jgi:glycosyltransferase involved in cell wall biosynthesis
MVARDGWGGKSTLFPGSLWLSSVVPLSARRDKVEVFWGTSGVLPPGLPTRAKTVLTVHDLVWHFYPDTMSRYNRIISAMLARSSIKRADIIIAPSFSTSKALESVLAVSTKRIRVVHEGVGEQFTPKDRDVARKFVADKYSVSAPYILAVGTIEPRKNIARLIEAFALFSRDSKRRYRLIVAGPSGWKTWATQASVERCQVRDRIHFLGWVDSKDLPWLYSGAELFVFPSLYEGFGLPVVEAMACGCPVVVSNCSSLPEVAGEVGVKVNPMDPGDIREGMEAAIETRDSLAARSLERASTFSWEKAAAATVRVIEEVCSL